MIAYESRIPVEPSYVEAVGRAFYNYATAAWSIVYLGSLIAPSFVTLENGLNFDEVSQGFSLLSDTGKIPDCIAIATRFASATAKRDDLTRSIPITAGGGAQVLDGTVGGKATQWLEEDVLAFAKELEAIDLDANALYYKLKVPAN